MKNPSVECVLDIKADVGECPVWCTRTSSLYWVDVYAGRLNRFDPSTGANEVWTFAEPIASYALCEADNEVIVALGSGLYRYNLVTRDLTMLVQPERGLTGNRMNDGRCDRAGRFWVGSMTDPPDPGHPRGTLYCYDGRSCEARIGGLIISNGLAFSPDERTMYHSDSHASVRTIWAWDLDPDSGTITNRRVFVDTHGMPGRPDGGAVDADGCYWSAAIDGWEIVRFAPDGAIVQRIAVPVAKPTMLAFGGDRLDTIFVTSLRLGVSDVAGQPMAGSLFAVQAGVRGVDEPRFAG